MKNNKEKKLSAVSILHYIKLIYRMALFIALIVGYIIYRVRGGKIFLTEPYSSSPIYLIVWVVFMVEMLLRFFPSRLESPGSQKQFTKNYSGTGRTDIVIQDNNATMLILLGWIVFNMILGSFRMMGIFDDGIMLILCGFYSVCDMICILFFCPFQSWFMKNKCCAVCRIYNWDYAMMFTPLFFVNNLFFKSLLFVSLALFVRWEVVFYMHPEYFSENTNGYLNCSNCTERLCVHKKQIHQFKKMMININNSISNRSSHE